MSGHPTLKVNNTDVKCVFSCTVEIEALDVTPAIVTNPDTGWTHVDSYGHFHAFSADSKNSLPTLNSSTLPLIDPACRPCEDDTCDGCYECYRYESYIDSRQEVLYTCKVCGVEVEPQWISGPSIGRVTIPGRKSYSISITSTDVPSAQFLIDNEGDVVSVVANLGASTIFGFGRLDVNSVDSVRGCAAIIDIIGVGMLYSQESNHG